jgi:AraC family transcriptional regulator, arabinose operon regulatory protein
LLDNSGVRDSYAFRYTELPEYSYGYIRGIGRERVHGTDYDWDGMTRPDKECCIFQYTLSGRGEIRTGQEVHALGPGDAFLVGVPGDHRYYFPEGAGHWEFYYLVLPVTEAVSGYIRKYGSLLHFMEDSEVIRSLLRILVMAQNRQIRDGYESSVLAYQFLMELYRSHTAGTAAADCMPEAVCRALQYMEQDYNRITGLDDIARISGLSRYHFLRLFRDCTGTTPVEQLNKLRIEQAASLLRTTSMTMEEIALHVGYANGNYFSKVFRHWVGTSPGRYRSGRDPDSADHLTIR